MNKATRASAGAPPAVAGRPPRRELLLPMLEGTKRSIVPIRREFIQKPRGTSGSRGSILSQLARDESALDAYLLLHALASSSEPYSAEYPAPTWTQLARLDEAATFDAARSRWSKVVSKLVALNVIERKRKGNTMDYRLLHESGSGEPYTRPKGTADGHWLRLPHSYWLDDYDAALTQPEKLMLLIALDLGDGFVLPFNQSAAWYGVSEATARRGLRGLEERGLLSKTSSRVVSPRSPTGWMEEFRYTREGAFSASAVEAAAKASRRGKGKVGFSEEDAS